ncbi:hypothetical protein ACHAWF_013175 [Thalassiosira exigua]
MAILLNLLFFLPMTWGFALPSGSTKSTQKPSHPPATLKPLPSFGNSPAYSRCMFLFVHEDRNSNDETIQSIHNRQDTSGDNISIANATMESNGTLILTKDSNISTDEGQLSLGMESGWANFGRYLLHLWTSSEPSQQPVTAGNRTETEEELDSMPTSTTAFGYDKKEHRGAVIDADVCTDEANHNETLAFVNGGNVEQASKRGFTRRLIRGTMQYLQLGRKNHQGMSKGTHSGEDELTSTTDQPNTALSEDELICEETNGSTIFEDSLALDKDEEGENENVTSPNSEIPSNLTSTKEVETGHRGTRRRHATNENTHTPSPIFTSLEFKDIDTSTRSAQRKWARRRRRLLVLMKAAKLSIVTFVFTFFAGNLINQFVDLDEDGSFEVHFGKVLSSPSPVPIDPVNSDKAKVDTRRKTSLFNTISSPKKQNFDGARAQALGLVSRAVQRVGPTVVRIETETETNGADEWDGQGRQQYDRADKKQLDGDGTGDLSANGEDRGDVFDGVPEAPPPSDDNGGQNIDFGQGSGIIVNSEGYILTNAHVVDGATRVYALLTDGRRFRAELQGSDDIVDVAVLKIVPEDSDKMDDHKHMMSNLPFARLGNSDQMEVGQFVTAIGSPGGLDNTCTIGIVSGLKRCPKVVGIPDKTGVLDYIQTDAAINQGNSGGPLVDVESGNIVGINTCIRANMEGTSFAIPINKVMGIVDDLSEGKHITHGYLGVRSARTC